MVEVYIKDDKEQYVVKVKNHADNTDLCNAISMHVYTIAGYLRNSKIRYAEKINPGDVAIAFHKDEGSNVLYDIVKIGFIQLQSAYPKLLNLTLVGSRT